MSGIPHERSTNPDYCTCDDDYRCPDCRALYREDANGERYVRNVAESCVKYPEWRYGQAAFNELPAWLRNEVCGTFLDPYHHTDVEAVNRFVAWAAEQIEAKTKA